jgi:hypothetical protein
LGTLTSPGWIAAEGRFKGVNTDKAVIEVDVDLEDNEVGTLWDTGASLDLVNARLAKVHDLETLYSSLQFIDCCTYLPALNSI